MSCVVAGLRYYFRIYKYEYLGELMTSELHISKSGMLIGLFLLIPKGLKCFNLYHSNIILKI